MLPLLKFLQSFFARVGPLPSHDEAYLSEAVDIYDLERRMRTIAERGRKPLSSLELGFFGR